MLCAALGAAVLTAQVSGDRGIAPVASSTDISVGGIEVDATGENAQDARSNGWRQAQRLAWEQLDGPDIPDARLDSLVSSIVIEQESIGPRRYIARLGVIFDRQRAGGLLGAGGARSRSAPMLTLPVMISGGTQTMFEQRNPWQRAWAEYQFGGSAIDYVRPAGTGGESLLLTYGQTGRRSRAWWNNILDEFSAADILVPIADLKWSYPGGPVEGRFTARYGPDNRFLGNFQLRADNAEALPAMLTRAVERFNGIYERALEAGTLRPDPTLTMDNIQISPVIQRLLAEARAAERAAAQPRREPTPAATPEPVETPEPTVAVGTFAVQVATPDAGALDSAVANIRGAPGVRGVSITSTALGGASVLSVSYAGDLSGLAAALRARGFAVNQGPGGLGISR